MSEEQPHERRPEPPPGWDYSSHHQKAGGSQIIMFLICAIVLTLTPVVWLLWLWLSSPSPARP